MLLGIKARNKRKNFSLFLSVCNSGLWKTPGKMSNISVARTQNLVIESLIGMKTNAIIKNDPGWVSITLIGGG